MVYDDPNENRLALPYSQMTIKRQICLPKDAGEIIEKLSAAGFEAFAVGGCVRDSVIGREPGDWDITTSATPQQVKALFKRTIDTGIKHGTVTVMMHHVGYEVTTYRMDGEYEDHRHPDHVDFTDDLIEDLKRRDFTINAMAYNPAVGIVDAFDGMGDLERGVIRCVGEAEQRFDEDALRILRAVRFAAQLGYVIDEDTQKAMKKLAGRLSYVSAERIQTELVKLLTSPHPEMIGAACDLGITAVVMPEYDRIRGISQNTPNHIYDVEVHTLKALQAVEPKTALRLALLFHDFGKPEVKQTGEDGRDTFYKHPEVSMKLAQKIMRRLKFDNDTRERVVRLVKWHGLKYSADPVSVRRAMNRIGGDLFEDFIKVQRADVSAKNPAVIPEKLASLDEKEALFRQIMDEKQCFNIKGLCVTGSDLIRAGMKSGPLIGDVLAALVERVIDDPALNERDRLLEIAMEIKDDPKALNIEIMRF